MNRDNKWQANDRDPTYLFRLADDLVAFEVWLHVHGPHAETEAPRILAALRDMDRLAASEAERELMRGALEEARDLFDRARMHRLDDCSCPTNDACWRDERRLMDETFSVMDAALSPAPEPAAQEKFCGHYRRDQRPDGKETCKECGRQGTTSELDAHRDAHHPALPSTPPAAPEPKGHTERADCAACDAEGATGSLRCTNQPKTCPATCSCRTDATAARARLEAEGVDVDAAVASAMNAVREAKARNAPAAPEPAGALGEEEQSAVVSAQNFWSSLLGMLEVNDARMALAAKAGHSFLRPEEYAYVHLTDLLSRAAAEQADLVEERDALSAKTICNNCKTGASVSCYPAEAGALIRRAERERDALRAQFQDLEPKLAAHNAELQKFREEAKKHEYEARERGHEIEHWKRASGFESAEALDFYLGRQDLKAHEKVQAERHEKQLRELRAEIDHLRLERKAATEAMERVNRADEALRAEAAELKRIADLASSERDNALARAHSSECSEKQMCAERDRALDRASVLTLRLDRQIDLWLEYQTALAVGATGGQFHRTRLEFERALADGLCWREQQQKGQKG